MIDTYAQDKHEEYVMNLEFFISSFINHVKSDLINLESSPYLLEEAVKVLGLKGDCHD